MIDLKNKRGVIEALEAAGFAPVKRHFADGTSLQYVNNEQGAQALIDAYNELPFVKQQKINAIRTEAATRVNALYAWVDNFDKIVIMRDLYLSIASAARSPVANISKMVNILQAANTAIQSVTNAADTATVDAVTVAWPP